VSFTPAAFVSVTTSLLEVSIHEGETRPDWEFLGRPVANVPH
jgi:hypothetical protein